MPGENHIVRGGMTVVGEIRVRVYDGGALSIEGPTADGAWCVAVLENALDAIRRKHSREIVVPGRDVTLPERSPT